MHSESPSRGRQNLKYPFQGLINTVFATKKYFKYVKPVEVVLGSKRIWKKQKGKVKIVQVKTTYQYVPLLESLQALTTLKDVHQQIQNGHNSSDTFLSDFCDGEFVLEKLPLEPHVKHLLLALYFDELEVANPLGSKRGKHKLGVFYWQLLNVEPKYRSQLRFIQLLAVVNSKNLKTYGIDKVLEQCVKDLQYLSNEGITVQVKGTTYHYKGYVVAFLADTPAAGLLGGFKEGVGGAYRCCRSCMVKTSEIKDKLKISELRLRKKDTHVIHCQLLESEDHEESFSKEYGVNRESILNEIPYFDVCICLPHDIMHVIMEGVLPKNIKLLLQHCIERKFFSLSTLNRAISTFDYGSHEKQNLPRTIDREKLVGSEKITQSASQMWLLGRVLPLMIGKYVPDDDPHWKCFIHLLRLMTIATAATVSEHTTIMLTMIVEEYLTSLYPLKLTPKFHYLLHLPRQMELFGPLRNQWCMRFEAKNYLIKSFVGRNFKNVPKSVTQRHQHYMCLEMMTPPGMEKDFLQKIPKIGTTKMFDFTNSSVPPSLRETIKNEFNDERELILPCATTLTVNGLQLSTNVAVCLTMPSDEDYPLFGLIEHLLLVPSNGRTYQILISEVVTAYDPHYNAYKVEEKSKVYRLISFNEIVIPDILPIHCISDIGQFIVIRSCHHVDFPI